MWIDHGSVHTHEGGDSRSRDCDALAVVTATAARLRRFAVDVLTNVAPHLSGSDHTTDVVRRSQEVGDVPGDLWERTPRSGFLARWSRRAGRRLRARLSM